MYLLLFDIDGTLLHTNGLSKTLFCRALGETFGVEVPWTGAVYDGRPDRRLALDLLIGAGIGEEAARGGLGAAFTRLGQLWTDEGHGVDMTIYPGVLDLLAALTQDDRVLLGQVTANVRPAALGKLRAAGIDTATFPVGAYGDEAESRAELPPKAIQRGGIFAGRQFVDSEVIVIGDSPADIRCARAAGVRCLAVATGRHRPADLAPHRPDFLLDNLADTDRVLTILGLA